MSASGDLLHRLAPIARRVLGSPRRLTTGVRPVPVSRHYGYDRGTPIDRYYIEAWLARYAGADGYAQGSIGGRVLEIGGREYADRFGGALGADRPLRVDVLHENAAHPDATFVGDLCDPSLLPAGAFDCIVCTQVLPVIWDVPAAISSMHAALAPGGAVFATMPGISRALTPDRDHWGDWWRFTEGSARRRFTEGFPGGEVTVETFGNVLSATLFLHGFAAEELTARELDLRDPNYEVTVAVRATKAR